MKNHKLNCKCYICQSIRGETYGKNNANWKGGKPKCIDCGIEIGYRAKRCGNCKSKGKLNAMYNKIGKKHPFFGGKHTQDSKNKIGKSNKGKLKGKNCHLYIDGRCSKKYYCIDCGEKICFHTALYGGKRCKRCCQKGSNNNMFGKVTHGKCGEYKGIKMRSSWELIFAQWLDLSGYIWKYEPKNFDLGNATYTPDFYLSEFDTYIEIKGYWRKNAKKKFIQFKKKYNNIALQVFNKKKLYNIINLV